MSQTKAELIEPQGNVAFDTNTLYVDATNNRVGVGTTTPSSLLTCGTTTGANAFSILAPGVAEAVFSLESASPNALAASANGFAWKVWNGSTFAERARIDSSGRLLVGTSSSTQNTRLNQKLAIVHSGQGYPGIGLTAYPGAQTGEAGVVDFNKSRGITDGSMTVVASGDTLGYLVFRGADGTNFVDSARIIAQVDGTPGADDMPGRLVFSTTADGASSPTERMRIRQDGSILINATSNVGTNPYLAVSAGANEGIVIANSTGATRYPMGFLQGTTYVGSISTTGSSTAYNTSSDYRLKENIVPVTDGINRLQNLKPSRFNFKIDPETTVDGFIAHEVQSVVPEAITGKKDAVDDDGNPIYQGIDQSKLVPLLTAALQEAIGEIESLKARVAALESA